MNDFMKEGMESLENVYADERKALADCLKRRGEYEVFSYYSRLATYFSARREADIMRAMIDEDMIALATSECTEMDFETSILENLKELYAAPFATGYSAYE